MEFQYIGQGDSPPQHIVFMGYKFELGGTVDVEDEAAIAKLKGNQCFKFEFSDDSELESMRAELTAADVKVDGRWGEERLRAELAALGRDSL